MLCLFACVSFFFPSILTWFHVSWAPYIPWSSFRLDICVTSLCLNAFLSLLELCHFVQHTDGKMEWLPLKGGQNLTVKGLQQNGSCVSVLVQSQRLHCDLYTLTLYLHSALVKPASTESRKEPEKRAALKYSGTEQRTSHLSQAHLLAGAVKRRRYVDSNFFWLCGSREHC